MYARCRTPVAIVGLALALGPGAGSAQDPTPDKVDAVFSGIAGDGPGCAVGVYRDGDLVFEKGYGMANLDWGVEVDPSTVFYVGSVSKQFTAAAIALLARGGRLSLEDDVRKWIPELPEYPSTVTVEHLVHHTGGIMDMYAAMMDSGMNIYDPIDAEEAIAVLASKPLDFAPGERWSYSNGGYFLLAQIVERASGMSFTEFTTRNIFEPLGMTDTHFHSDPGHVVPRRAMSYEAHDSGEIKQNYVSTFAFVGQGGLYTTVGDLIKWDRNFYESRVGGAGFREFMETTGVLNDGGAVDYAFGLRHDEYRGQATVGHSGGMMGFRAYMERFPDQRLTVATLCNQSQINPGELSRRVADLFLADVLEPRLER